MSTAEDPSECIVIRGKTMNLKLPLDLSRRIREEAERQGITVALLVNEVLRERLARDGYDVGPPLTEAQMAQMMSAADHDDDQDRSSEAQ